MEIPQFMELQSKTAGAKAATQGAKAADAMRDSHELRALRYWT